MKGSAVELLDVMLEEISPHTVNVAKVSTPLLHPIEVLSNIVECTYSYILLHMCMYALGYWILT